MSFNTTVSNMSPFLSYESQILRNFEGTPEHDYRKYVYVYGGWNKYKTPH